MLNICRLKITFLKIIDEAFSDAQLNNEISKWAFQWKMLFNLDPSKQAIEICLSHKHYNENYLLATSRKHLGLILDSKNLL